jgi:hypothetical protein
MSTNMLPADLCRTLSAYLNAAGLRSAPPDSPLFRRIARKASTLTTEPMTDNDMRRMLKQRMARTHLPETLSPHSFRVYVVPPVMWRSAATILEFQLAIIGNAT